MRAQSTKSHAVNMVTHVQKPSTATMIERSLRLAISSSILVIINYALTKGHLYWSLNKNDGGGKFLIWPALRD